MLAEVPSGGSRLASDQRLVCFELRLRMFPSGGAGFIGVPGSLAPAGRQATAGANPQTIGTIGASAATQTVCGSPFTLDSDIRFPLEGMRNTGFYDENWQKLAIF